MMKLKTGSVSALPAFCYATSATEPAYVELVSVYGVAVPLDEIG